MAVLQREKQIFEQMQRDSSTFRQKEKLTEHLAQKVNPKFDFLLGAISSMFYTSIVDVLDDKYLN